MSSTPPPDEQLPTLAEAKADVERSPVEARRTQRHFERRFNVVSTDAQREYAHLNGIKDHYKHKKRWSNFLIGVMAYMILFQSFLLWRVGTASWDFSKYEWLLPALMVQNLAQIVGLAVFVVKALFKELK